MHMPGEMAYMIIIALRERILDFYSDITIQFITCSSVGGGDINYCLGGAETIINLGMVNTFTGSRMIDGLLAFFLPC